MEFKAEVIKELSMEPNFKVRFYYKTDKVTIEKGYAEVIREYPKSVIKYDSYTDGFLEEVDKAKLELEILNIVFDYLLTYGVLSSCKGRFILRTA
ncbi:MAG: hypothetical protein ACOYWZ_01885 [Bacillota bacterium]